MKVLFIVGIIILTILFIINIAVLVKRIFGKNETNNMDDDLDKEEYDETFVG